MALRERGDVLNYKGQCEIDGEEFWLSAWIKNGAKGKFMSIAFTAKEQPKNPPAREPAKQSREQQREARGGFDDMDDSDPPF